MKPSALKPSPIYFAWLFVWMIGVLAGCQSPDQKVSSNANHSAATNDAAVPNQSSKQWADRIRRESMAVRSATGPWKQIAAIETMVREMEVSGASPAGAPINSLPNQNVITFLDNQRFLIADGKHGIRVFDADTGVLLKRFGEPLPDNFWNRTWLTSPDGRLFAVLGEPEIRIWNTQTGELFAHIPRTTNFYVDAALTRDLKQIVTCHRGRDNGVTNSVVLWQLPESSGQAVPIRTFKAGINAFKLSLADPFILAREGRSVRLFDANTGAQLWSQVNETAEEFLFLDAEAASNRPVLGVLEYHPPYDKNWRQAVPKIRLVEIPSGNELRRWDCPMEEDDQNDHRYRSRYFISPQRSLFAISQAGRLNVFEFESAWKLFSVPCPTYRHLMAAFITEDVLAVSTESLRPGETKLLHARTGRELASLPDVENFVGAFSPDGRHAVIRRSFLPEGTNSSLMLREPMAILWGQTGAYPAP